MPNKPGPNTPEGKANVSQNALKLGIFSQRVLLRDEDPAALETLSAQIHTALEPDTDYESLLVDRIVAGWWRWARILKVASAQADAAYQEIFSLGDGLTLDQRQLRSLIASMSNDSSESIQRQADAVERQTHRAVTELRYAQACRIIGQPVVPGSYHITLPRRKTRRKSVRKHARKNTHEKTRPNPFLQKQFPVIVDNFCCPATDQMFYSPAHPIQKGGHMEDPDILNEANPGAALPSYPEALEGLEGRGAPSPADHSPLPQGEGQGEGTLAEALLQRDAALTERDTLRAQLAGATQTYRTAVLAGAPEVPPDLVSGDTPDEIDRSLAAARDLVEAIKSRLPQPEPASSAHPEPGPPAHPEPVEGRAAVQIPAGAPVRTGPDLTAMSAIEKIRYALTRS